VVWPAGRATCNCAAIRSGLYPVTAGYGLPSPARDSNRRPRVFKYDVTDRMYKHCNDLHSSMTRVSACQPVSARAGQRQAVPVGGATTWLMPAD
jgi:hypothetical protein